LTGSWKSVMGADVLGFRSRGAVELVAMVCARNYQLNGSNWNGKLF
jgi:hypothetical protein